ncbi:hypothetical protein DFP72DRAFT_839431 [Ephemerocybe angulata]|uniref:Uncharacterized protein n=1 Tax=Ephemerocybe angulata TaxID=980116 RepID=A0A8H6MH14_9AGAR|nr:hypothetical protein DFP72DRAFT_839431 [Tulosesus angulatus]
MFAECRAGTRRTPPKLAPGAGQPRFDRSFNDGCGFGRRVPGFFLPSPHLAVPFPYKSPSPFPPLRTHRALDAHPSAQANNAPITACFTNTFSIGRAGRCWFSVGSEGKVVFQGIRFRLIVGLKINTLMVNPTWINQSGLNEFNRQQHVCARERRLIDNRNPTFKLCIRRAQVD